MRDFTLPDPLPIPTPDEIRATGWSGDVTRFPLTREGVLARCQYNGIAPENIPNAAWYYAPNQYVQQKLNGDST